jgi:hypothetical protein
MTKLLRAVWDWAVRLAADNCRASPFDDRQIEALLYHELKHYVVGGEGREAGEGGLDLEVFADELRRYGYWNDWRKALAGWSRGRTNLEED